MENDYPSVTQLLPPVKIWVSPVRWAELMEEGNYRHDLMKMYFDFGVIIDPWQEKFAELIESKKPEWGKLIYCEKRLISEKYRYHGKPDLVFENAIVDLKSSVDKKRCALQVGAGYKILIDECTTLSIPDISVFAIDKDLNIVDLYSRRVDKSLTQKELKKKKIERSIDTKKTFFDLLNIYYAQKRIDYYFLAEKYKEENK